MAAGASSAGGRDGRFAAMGGGWRVEAAVVVIVEVSGGVHLGVKWWWHKIMTLESGDSDVGRSG